MWTRSCHRFTNEAAFLAACDAAGWPRDHLDRPDPPASVQLDIIGALADPRYHVNASWYCQGVDAAWTASEIVPVTPSRTWA